MFPNKTNLNIPGSQTVKDDNAGDKAIISNDFATPNIPVAAPHDPVRALFIIILIISALSTLALFGYSMVLSNQISTSEKILKNYDESTVVSSFNSNLGDIKSLSQRLKLLDNIYNNHIYVSQMLLPILESLTESNSNSYVYFNKFSVRVDKNNLANVSLSGVSINYESLIRQINNFKNPKYAEVISNFKLNSLSLDQSGNVLFDVTFDANISGKKYNDYISDISGDSLSQTYSSSTNFKSGPLFKQEIPATNTVPVSVQAIYDSINSSSTANTRTEIISTSTTNSTSSKNTPPTILIGN